MTSRTRRSRHSLREEEGSVLAISLVFVLVIGLVVATLLTRVDVGLRTTRIVRATTDKTYAADAGIEHGIETLRLHSEVCGAPSDEPLPLGDDGTIEVDGITVQVTCRTLSGSSSGIDGWAVITTDDVNPGLTTEGAAGPDKRTIEGPVFSARISPTLNLTVKRGNLYERACTPTPAGLVFVPSPPYAHRCTDAPIPDPAHDLPSARPSPEWDEDPGSAKEPPQYVLDSGCAIFLPGTYLKPPDLKADNYFVSGTYYFDSIGEWDVAARGPDRGPKVYGGQPGGDATINEGFPSNPGFTPCADDDTVAAKFGVAPNGTGVKLIFGGDSWLHVGNLGSMELWSRAYGDSPPDEGTEGISFQTVTGDPPPPAGFIPSNRWPQPVVQVDTGARAELSMHGMLYAPNGFVDFFATYDSKAQLVGGVVAGRLNLKSSASASGLAVSSQAGAPGGREVEIVARALGAGDGGRDIVSKAIAFFPNAEFGTSQVLSWRNDVR